MKARRDLPKISKIWKSVLVPTRKPKLESVIDAMHLMQRH